MIISLYLLMWNFVYNPWCCKCVHLICFPMLVNVCSANLFINYLIKFLEIHKDLHICVQNSQIHSNSRIGGIINLIAFL